MKVQVINLSNNKLPQYETPMSAGMDVRADFSRVTVDNPIKAFGDCEILLNPILTRLQCFVLTQVLGHLFRLD